ncbi:MAG: hypothetical protein U9R69_02540 [Thermodesulfobacteriota bacterium]|nr:hypothetical protein [Thermodesulfobacteriota bacterium]
MKNKPFHVRELGNGIVIEFFDHGNRYFGDYHRVKIDAVAMIPFHISSLAEELQPFAATYSGSVRYEKSMEQMGVATNQLQSVTESLIDNFIMAVAVYLESEGFAERLLRNKKREKAARPCFSPQ